MAALARHQPGDRAAGAGAVLVVRLLYADVEHHYSRTFRRLLRGADLAEIDAAWQELSRQAAAQLEIEGFTGKDARLRRSGAMHYQGQSFELTVPVPDGQFDTAMVAHLEGGLRPRARDDLRPSRRTRRAGRAGVYPGHRPRSARGERRARARFPKPRGE
jgi:hypothetical protein